MWTGLGYESPDFRDRRDKIVKCMRMEGLYSEKTNDCDIPLMGLIDRVRRNMREDKGLNKPISFCPACAKPECEFANDVAEISRAAGYSE